MTTIASIPLTKSQPDTPTQNRLVKVALIDLYNGEANLGIKAIQDMVTSWGRQTTDVTLELDRFDTRTSGKIPNLDYDFYISSGGPGSPYEGVGTAWENAYFRWVDAVWKHNNSLPVKEGTVAPKHVLFICHSFQMMCRHFELGDVVKRKSQSFGVFKTHPTPNGLKDPLFEGLNDPFYVADFRDWQVLQVDQPKLKAMGASILAYEKIRPHVPLERAVMAIRISPEMVGVQFHPEANPAGMLVHFQKDDLLINIIRDNGHSKFNQIIERLEDPDFLLKTHQSVIPNFLQGAVSTLF